MGLIVRSSAIHAAGCYTTSPIAKGARVVEYTGPLIDKEEADRRYDGKPITYLFAIGDNGHVIDGHGTAMFINHSCAANCETEEIDGHVWIVARRDIAPGEEICYDYCLFDGDEQDAPCNCGASNCRGSMFSLKEMKKRERLSRKRTTAANDLRRRAAPGRRASNAPPAVARNMNGKQSSTLDWRNAGDKKGVSKTFDRDLVEKSDQISASR